MCKAAVVLALLLHGVPRSAVAQGTPATGGIDRPVTRRFDLVMAASHAPLPPPGPLQRAVASDATRVTLSRSSPRLSSHWSLQQTKHGRSRIGRHPVLFGMLVGFGTGFLVGYLPGDDGVFDDFTAGFNGWVLGGVGAAAGAGVGAIVRAATR